VIANRSTVALQSDVSAWPTLLDFFAHKFPHISRDTWAQRFHFGEIQYVNESNESSWVVAHAHDTPRAHARLSYRRHVENEIAIPFEARVVFEDEYILVADKPNFLPVAPSGSYVKETLLARLQALTQNPQLAPAHRIDRETAGLVLFTKRAQHRNAFQALFRERRIEKTYEAIAPLNSTLTFPFVYRSRLMRSENFMQATTVVGEPNAETLIDVIESFEQDDRALAHLKLVPRTGVRHQLRAQLAALGMPIIGDRIYPNLLDHAPSDFSNPLQLVARKLSFMHPFTGRDVVLQSSFLLQTNSYSLNGLCPIETGDRSINDMNRSSK
jgi:tRNA pseudouridine32 synthase / 23S rRNA pseudouridine746 synthase